MSKSNTAYNEGSFDLQVFGRIIKYMILIIILYSIIFSNTHVVYAVFSFITYIVGIILYPFKSALSPLSPFGSSESADIGSETIGLDSIESIDVVDPVDPTTISDTVIDDRVDIIALTNMGKIVRALIGM